MQHAMFSAAELSRGDAEALRPFPSEDAFTDYVASCMRQLPGAAAAVMAPHELTRLIHGSHATWPAPCMVVENEAAMGPAAREVLERLRDLVVRERMLDDILPAAGGEAPRFAGASMSIGTHVPFRRDASALDSGAAAAARATVFFCLGVLRVLSFCALRRASEEELMQVQMRQRHGDAVVLRGDITRRCEHGALNLNIVVAEFELRYEMPTGSAA